MATNFSPCKGSYVLNQFPSNVMFGMNGFHVSASGAIQGHHSPLGFFGFFCFLFGFFFFFFFFLGGGGIRESACLSVCPSLCSSVYKF